jgi:hypothetical protein
MENIEVQLFIGKKEIRIPIRNISSFIYYLLKYIIKLFKQSFIYRFTNISLLFIESIHETYFITS